jgi:hypothetical protein
MSEQQTKPVYCRNCKHLWVGREFGGATYACHAPLNLGDWLAESRPLHNPAFINQHNDCGMYQRKEIKA